MSKPELHFVTKIRTQLPDLKEESVASEMRDRDTPKWRQKADLIPCDKADLIPCDKGLVKQERKNKVSTMFALEPYENVKKTGNNVIIESLGVNQLLRNMTHVKKYQVPFPDSEETRKA